MKKLKNWFIGDYLAETDDVFVRAKIELLYNYSLAFLFLGSIFYINCILNEKWYHVYIITFAVFALSSIPFILKYKKSVKAASNWYVIQQTIVSSVSIIIQGGNPDITGSYWICLFILFSFFLYGLKWGTIIILISTVISSVAGAISQIIEIPDSQKLPDTPNVFMVPLLLVITVIWMFIKTRNDAEKHINKQKLALEEKNKEVMDSIMYAERIQKAILPSQRIVEYYLPNSFVVYLPKDIVSGDFYWVEKKEETTFFAVADCTGHGVPGAMMSVIGQNALNRVLNEFNITQPSKMLDKLNELIEEAFAKSGTDVRDGMDIALCSLNYKTNTLEYAGAHNGLYIISNAELIETKGTKQPIGRFESKIPFKNHEIKLNTGDSIYIFSDGIADQFGGADGKKYKYKRVKELLLRTHKSTPSEQKNNIIHEFIKWKGQLEQLDDVCIMGVQIK